MRFYSMSHRDVLGLPINTFWMLDRNISRVRAEEDQRLLRLFLTAQSGDRDGIDDYASSLNAEIGHPVIERAVMEKGAIDRLKAALGAVNE